MPVRTCLLPFAQLFKPFHQRLNVALKPVDVFLSDHHQFFGRVVVALVLEQTVETHEEAAGETLRDAGLGVLITINNIHCRHLCLIKLCSWIAVVIRRTGSPAFGC